MFQSRGPVPPCRKPVAKTHSWRQLAPIPFITSPEGKVFFVERYNLPIVIKPNVVDLESAEPPFFPRLARPNCQIELICEIVVGIRIKRIRLDPSGYLSTGSYDWKIRNDMELEHAGVETITDAFPADHGSFGFKPIDLNSSRQSLPPSTFPSSDQ